MRVLAAGDDFVRPAPLADALRAELGDVEIITLQAPWPHTPFGPVGEVDEASGDEDDVIAALDGVEIAVTQMAPFTERVLAAAGSLRLVAVARGGPVNVNVRAARERGIAVTCAPGRNAPAAAELTVALILAALRRLVDVHATMVAGDWRSDLYALDACGDDIAGATVGVVGYGAIGRRVAGVLAALGAHVCVTDPYADPAELPDGFESVELDELLARSAVVTLHARLTPETSGLIGARELARMPPGAILVNTARGALVDGDALAAALEDGHLGAAALDVFEPEPLPADAALRRAPRVLLTPHLAGATRQTAARAIRIMTAEVGRFVRGQPLEHAVEVATA
jgi:D-3-phosphoglycerate dehydrogenase